MNRTEKAFVLSALGAGLVFFAIFMQINKRSDSSVSQIDTRNQINYQMARPAPGYAEYSLNGREVDQVYEALQQKEIAKSLEKVKKQTAAVVKKADPKKAEEFKKKEEAAKKLAAQTKQAQARQAQAAQQARLQNERARTESASTSTSTSSKKSASDESNYVNNVNPVSAATPAGSNLKPVDAEKAKAKKTYAEWRALMFSKPTRETMNQFLDAYRKSEVTAPEMQAMAQDLIDQNDENLKGLGLYALRATPSLNSLSQLVHAEASLSTGLKSYVEQAYLAYLQKQNVGYLNQALQTKDKTLILKSLNLLGSNLQSLAKGDYAALIDPRSRRDADRTIQFSMNDFKTLIPALTSITAAQDQDLSPLAQQVTTYIQSSSTVASN